MGNFNDIVPKRLNLVPARQATLLEAQTAPIPFDKYYTIVPTRDIKKIITYLDLPAFTLPANYSKYTGQLLWQYNIVAPVPFYILNAITIFPNIGGTLTVKWRVGNTVHRYFIFGTQQYTTNAGEIVDVQTFPKYINQLIPVNCSFEFWSIPFVVALGLQTPYKLMLNLLTDPPDVDTKRFDIIEAAPILNVTMGNNLPFNMPIAQPILAYNSN